MLFVKMTTVYKSYIPLFVSSNSQSSTTLSDTLDEPKIKYMALEIVYEIHKHEEKKVAYSFTQHLTKIFNF